MALPVGVTTATVTWGSLLTFFGQDTTVTVTVQTILGGNAQGITWVATGQTVLNFDEFVGPVTGVPASWASPHVDQDGWRDGSGNEFKNWSYRAQALVTGPRSQKIVLTKTYQVVEGQTNVDLDNVEDGTVGAPGSSPVPAVLSVGGLTGTITEEQIAEMAGGAIDLDPDTAALIADAGSDTAAALSAKIENARRFDPAISLLPIPGYARGVTGYNARSYHQDSVTTDSLGNIYAVWVDPGGRIVIGKKTMPFGTWQTIDTSTIPGTPLSGFVVNDSHNVVSLIADENDRIHVSGNMHGSGLRYMVSTNPRDISTWSTPGMIGTQETQVTYPRFALHPDGDLFFHYRDGVSGSGDTYLNRWNGSTWTRVAKITDGKTSSENAYENRFVIDRDGSLHLSMCWRPSGGDFNAANDLHYIVSGDKGATWTSVTGVAVALPLTHANTDALVLDTAPTNSGIINMAGMDVDRDGRPHLAITLADGSAPDRNIHHVWWDGDSWQNEQVTDLRNTMAYAMRPNRPAVACTDDGRTLIFYSTQQVSAGATGVVPARAAGTLRVIDATDGKRISDALVADLDGKEAEVTIDQRALRERGLIRMMLTVCQEEQTTPSLEYWHEDNWSFQFAGILTIDADQVDDITTGAADVPRIRTVAQLSTPEGQTISSATQVQVPNAQPIITPSSVRGRMVFARLNVRGLVSAGGTTLTVQINEVQQGGSSRQFGSMQFTSTSSAIKSTPWMPLRYGPINGVDAMIRMFGQATGGGTGSVSATLELGVLAGANDA